MWMPIEPRRAADRNKAWAMKSLLEETMALHIHTDKLPQPVREYRFDANRRWRFDFARPDKRLAVEVEGGIWTQGRHTRPAGYEADAEKYNAAVIQGWRVLRFTANTVNSGLALRTIKAAMGIIKD